MVSLERTEQSEQTNAVSSEQKQRIDTVLETAKGEEKSKFPPLDGIKEDLQTLRLISPAYAGREGELTAVLQYVYQSIMFGEMKNEEFSKAVMRIAVSEMHHLEVLGTLITKLGAPPLFTACPPYPVGYFSAACVNYTRQPRSMISADICAEENAIFGYERMLCRIKNPRVAEVLQKILSDEREHLKIFNSMLAKL